MKATRFLVGGRVQGVFFRASARDQAQALGLRGFARNLADGRVEVLVAGDEAAIEQMGLWLHNGPPGARVEELERMHADAHEAGAGFEIH